MNSKADWRLSLRQNNDWKRGGTLSADPSRRREMDKIKKKEKRNHYHIFSPALNYSTKPHHISPSNGRKTISSKWAFRQQFSSSGSAFLEILQLLLEVSFLTNYHGSCWPDFRILVFNIFNRLPPLHINWSSPQYFYFSSLKLSKWKFKQNLGKY